MLLQKCPFTRQTAVKFRYFFPLLGSRYSFQNIFAASIDFSTFCLLVWTDASTSRDVCRAGCNQCTGLSSFCGMFLKGVIVENFSFH